MAKRKKSLIVGRQIVQQLRSPEMKYRFEQLLMGQGRDGLQNRQRNQSADHRCRFENLFGDVLEVIDACRYDRLHGCGQRNRIHPALQPICTSLTLEITAFDNRIDEFLEKERITLRALDDIPA